MFNRKRILALILTAVFVAATIPFIGQVVYAASGSALSAKPSKTAFMMNGQAASVPEAYNVAESNYLQLRGIAALLNSTVAQFDVTWDGTYAVIETGKPYTGTANPATLADTTDVRKSNTQFKIDGKLVSFDKAYYIDGDTNYLQLREFAEKLNGTGSQFNLYYDEAANQAFIEPGKAYTGVKPTSTVTVYVDGVKFSFPTYVFNGTMCVNVRDIAHSFVGTSKEFNLKWVDYPLEDAREKDDYHIVSEKYVAVGNEMKAISVDFSKATKTPLSGYALWFMSDPWSYRVDNAIFVDFKELAFSMDFEFHQENDTIRIETGKSYHTAAGLEWWKIDPKTLSYLPNEWASQYSFRMLLAKLENEPHPHRFIYDNYTCLEYLKNQPAEAYEGAEDILGNRTPYQRQMEIITWVKNWLVSENIDVSRMTDAQKIMVIKNFWEDERQPYIGDELYKIINPLNTYQLTARECGYKAALADAFMIAMGVRYTFHNLGGDINGTGHAWNGYWDAEAGEYLFFDLGFGHYNMRYEDLWNGSVGDIYILLTT